MQIAIVGAGIIGLCTAIQLRRTGFDVCLFEKHKAGQGASSAAMGSLTPYSDHEASSETRELALKSLALYPAFLDYLYEQTGKRVDFDTRGVFEIAITDNEVFDLQESFTKNYTGLKDIAWLNNVEVLELEPNIAPNVQSAIHYKTESVVDVSQLLEACVACARNIGVVFFENIDVKRILKKNGNVIGIETTGQIYYADCIVIAPGVSLNEIDGLNAPVEIEKICGEVIEVKGPPNLIKGCLYAGNGFIAPRRDGRLFLGSSYSKFIVGDDENRHTIRAGTALTTLEATIRLLPSVSNFEITRTWKAWRPKTPSAQPWIGEHSLIRNLFFAIGFYGLGITNALQTALNISNEIIKKYNPRQHEQQ